MKKNIKKIIISLITFVMCVILSGCNSDNILSTILENVQEKLSENASDNYDNYNDNNSGFRYCSKITFEFAVDRMFYCISDDLLTMGSYPCILTIYYDTETGEYTSADLKLQLFYDMESAEATVNAINTDEDLTIFMSNPQIFEDLEWEYGDINGYYITADIDLDNVKINSFIDCNYLVGHNVKALEEEIKERGLFDNDEIGENYTYDAGEEFRIEWFY